MSWRYSPGVIGLSSGGSVAQTLKGRTVLTGVNSGVFTKIVLSLYMSPLLYLRNHTGRAARGL